VVESPNFRKICDFLVGTVSEIKTACYKIATFCAAYFSNVQSCWLPILGNVLMAKLLQHTALSSISWLINRTRNMPYGQFNLSTKACNKQRHKVVLTDLLAADSV